MTDADKALLEAYVYSPEFKENALREYGKGYAVKIDYAANLITFSGKKKLQSIRLDMALEILKNGHIDQ